MGKEYNKCLQCVWKTMAAKDRIVCLFPRCILADRDKKAGKGERES